MSDLALLLMPPAWPLFSLNPVVALPVPPHLLPLADVSGVGTRCWLLGGREWIWGQRLVSDKGAGAPSQWCQKIGVSRASEGLRTDSWSRAVVTAWVPGAGCWWGMSVCISPKPGVCVVHVSISANSMLELTVSRKSQVWAGAPGRQRIGHLQHPLAENEDIVVSLLLVVIYYYHL